jgi:DNA-binding transcriptional LysR family regulator
LRGNAVCSGAQLDIPDSECRCGPGNPQRAKMGFIVPPLQQSAMHSEVDDLLLFAEIARRRSITGAAGAVGLPKSTVSRRLTALELRLKTTLVLRSTRAFELTAAGHELHEHAQRIGDEVSLVRHWATRQSSEPSGRLRVSLAADFAQFWMAGPIADFRLRYPKVRLEMDLSPRRADLVVEGLDCAVRMGTLPDSTLVARKLTDVTRSLYASPALIAARGLPNELAELADWPRVEITQDQKGPLRLQRGKRKAELPWQGELSSNNVGMVRQLILAGAGFGMLADVMCQAELADGRLVRLLPQWQASPVPAWLLTPSRNLPARTRAFVDHMVQALAPTMPS